MRIAREEIFGPVVSILRWTDEDDLSRGSTRSTSASPRRSGRTISTARIASRRESKPATSGSTARARTTSAFRSAELKQSGLGREESIEELLACTQIKNVNVTLRDRRNVTRRRARRRLVRSRRHASAPTIFESKEDEMHASNQLLLASPPSGPFRVPDRRRRKNIAVGNYGSLGERHAVRRRARQGLLQGGGRQRHRHHRLGRAAARRCAT